ncbi:DNA-binding winged helix-turn-helix (wHTH) protein [Caulobacter ginsengisoli]|uniref:DNA-binding winged helix-turn-helix (WHTH) protein n=1 Tax=Caulobacter ginsengisoli TaxID=400775 RepID=A0ABU0IX18_9CAUL|nr:transcriptional regulator [Caulobacter ginsengisoli]MDQ0465497.1 DNA-binding winged helix-turn-helix (wHTH) protein [Caulobacter ginsengisoli]
MPQTYELGDWIFTPAAQELRRGEARVRLEHRAARALELLCERRGEVVTQAELIQRLWQGRQVSDNSLAVVIGDLRRALGDNARQPRFVETVAKAGYRLIAPAQANPSNPRRREVLALAAAGLAAVAVWGGYRLFKPGPRLVVVEPVENATGEAAYDALAQACSGLILTDLGQEAGLRLRRRSPGAPIPAGAVRLTARLTLWSGQPYLVLTAEEGSSVIWSGAAFGLEASLPAKVKAQLADLAATLRGDHPSREKP